MPILGIWASQISGHLWAPEGAYDALGTLTLSANATSVTISGVPTGYKHLQIRANVLTSHPNNDLGVRFNDDSASNYNTHTLYGSGSVAGSLAVTSSTFLGAAFSQPSDYPGSFVMDILDYANSNKFKTTRSLWGHDRNGGTGYVGLYSGAWRSTSTISSITFYNTFSGSTINTNTQFALYGVK